MTNPKPKLAVYHGTALALSGIACIASTVYAFTFAQNHSSGYGALGEFLVLVFMLIVTGILLLHSSIVSILYCIKNSPKSYWGILINSLMIFLLLSPLLYTGMSHLFAVYETRSSFEYRFDNACAEKSPQRVLKMINEIRIDTKENDQYQNHLDNCIETAVRNRRIDLLDHLEDNQIVVVNKDAENFWRKLIDILATQNINAQDLELLEWLIERGKGFNYRLEPDMYFFSHYNICYTNLELPEARQFAERLIAMGADINSDPNSYAAWYCARFNRIDALRFLGQHKIAIKNNPDYDSVLGEAIANHNLQMVELLIELGAKPAYKNYEKERTDCIKYSGGDIQDNCKHIYDYDDLVTACMQLKDDEKIKEKRQIIALLQQAGFRFEKNPDYQLQEIIHPEILKCLKGFEKN